MLRRYKKGKKRPSKAGRPKGTPNKITTNVKRAFEEAFEKKGGVPSFIRWAKENETEFYRLYAKLLPKDLKLDGVDSVKVVYLPLKIHDIKKFKDFAEKIKGIGYENDE